MTMLEIGARKALSVRDVEFSHLGTQEVKLLYASDLHLRLGTEHVAHQLREVVERTQPTVVLLGGDLVDYAVGLAVLQELIVCLRAYCPVWAVPGNHDVAVGLTEVRCAIEYAGGLWLEGASQQLGDAIRVDGAMSQDTIADLDAQAMANAHRFSVLCTHYPSVFPTAVRAGYDLVLAGHLHAGQVVLWQHHQLFYPGALSSPWNGPRFSVEKSTMLVSNGVHDTLPIRWNCPREVLLCKIR